MTDISWLAAGPLISLTAAVVLLLMLDVFLGPDRRIWAVTAAAGLAGALITGVVLWDTALDDPRLAFSDMVAVDGFTALGIVALTIVAGLGVVLAWPLAEEQGDRGAEFVSLMLVSLMGAIIMVAAANFILLFLGLEVMSISFYVLAGFSRTEAASDEAAVKYFLLGSFASAVFVYGVALAFASTGSLSIVGAGAFLDDNLVLDPGLILAAVGLLVVGLLFKVSAAPFHWWAPDVYQGAASGVSGFLAAVAKLAGFAALLRILAVGFDELSNDWAPAVAAVAAISILVGTALAIAQTDIKRMLAYSSIAHAGFILTGILAGPDGIEAVWFYTITYAFQVLAAFGVVAVMSGPGSVRSPLSDYSGLGRRNPLLAGVLGLMMLAMGGIPLTAGFIGKVAVFQAAMDAGYTWLVVLALVASVAGLFFYLRVVVLMYMQAPALSEAPGAAPLRPEASDGTRIALTVAAAVTLAFGIVPAPLLEVAADALPFTL